MNRIYPADFLIIAVFFMALPVIGIYFAGRMKNIKDFFSGGAALPWWLSGVSFYMSSFSAFAFVSYSELSYNNGISAWVVYWCQIPAAIISAMIFAARWRRASTTSPLEYIRERYTNVMRQCLAWLGLPLKIVDNALRLFSISVLVAVSLGVNFTQFSPGLQKLFVPGTEMYWMVILSGLIILIYAFMGGLWAIVVTDFVQFLILLAAAIVLWILSVNQMVTHGGLSSFITQAKAADPGFFHFFNKSKIQDLNASYVISWLVIISMSFSSTWALVQRYYSVRTDREARGVGLLTCALVAVTPFLLFLPALLARVYHPGIDPVTQKNQVYAIVCISLLPAGMIGLLVSALFSSTMSAISGDFNALSAVVTSDIYKHIRPHGQPREYLLVGRIFTVVIGLTIMGMTLFIVYLFKQDKPITLFQMMTKLFSYFLPPMAIPMLFGLWNRRINKVSGFIGLLCGITTGFTVFLFSIMDKVWFDVDSAAVGKRVLAALAEAPQLTAKEWWIYNLGQTWLILTLTVSATIVGMIIGSLLAKDNAEGRAQIDGFFHRLERPEDLVIAEREKKLKVVEFTPFPLIGLVYGSLGAAFIVIVQFATNGAPDFDRKIGTWTGVGMIVVAVGIYCLKFVVAAKNRPAKQ